MLAAVALAVTAIVLITRDHGDPFDSIPRTTDPVGPDFTTPDFTAPDFTTPDFTTPGSTTPGQVTLDVTGVAIPASPDEILAPRLSFAPNPFGFVSAELDNDGQSADAAIVVERESGAPFLMSGGAGGTAAITDPSAGEITVEIHDSTATLSWSGIDGSEGAIDIPIPDDQLAAFHTAGLPNSLAMPRHPAATFDVSSVVRAQGDIGQATAHGEVLVTFETDPSEAPVKVRPDDAYCRNVPVSPKAAAGLRISSVTCSGALNTTRRAFRTVFDATVDVRSVSYRTLSSPDADAALAACLDRLTSFSTRAGWVGTVFTWLGFAAALYGAGVPMWLNVTLAGGSAAGDTVSRVTNPDSAPTTCRKELTIWAIGQDTAQYLHSVITQMPLAATPLVPTYEVTGISGPVTIRPFPQRNWNQDTFVANAVFGPAKISLKKTVGTGAVEVTLSWTGSTDMDLHVIDPSGNEIYYSSSTSPTGGQLDRDQIPGCGPNLTRNAEHIFWPTNGAPSGNYQVFVVAFDTCGGSNQLVELTAAVNGQEVLSQRVDPVSNGGTSPTWTITVP